MFYESASECEAKAQHMANATGHDYVVWYEKYGPYRFTYTRDNHDGTMRAPFGMRHWSNHRPANSMHMT